MIQEIKIFTSYITDQNGNIVYDYEQMQEDFNYELSQLKTKQ